jgi:hypothetical protein
MLGCLQRLANGAGRPGAGRVQRYHCANVQERTSMTLAVGGYIFYRARPGLHQPLADRSR